MLWKMRVRGLNSGECGSQRERDGEGRQEDNPGTSMLIDIKTGEAKDVGIQHLELKMQGSSW